MAGMNMQVTQSVKGSMIRQEMQGPMGAMVNIVDTESSMMTTIMPAQKMYMRVDMNAMMEQYAQQSAAQPQPNRENARNPQQLPQMHPITPSNLAKSIALLMDRWNPTSCPSSSALRFPPLKLLVRLKAKLHLRAGGHQDHLWLSS